MGFCSLHVRGKRRFWCFFLQREIQQRQEHLEELQARLDRVHKAQHEAEEEEEVLQQLKLACSLPEEQQHETAGLHHLSGLPLERCPWLHIGARSWPNISRLLLGETVPTAAHQGHQTASLVQGSA